MSEPFIHRAFIEGYWPVKDEYYTFTAFVAEVLAVYYWCESFCDSTRGQRRAFCVIGQRGLSEYAAQATHKVVAHIGRHAEGLQEHWGWQFGSACALREALRVRRDTEVRQPEYMAQCNISTYRAKKQLHHNKQKKTKDTPITFDLDGFKRGKQQVWTLTQFKTPSQALDAYAAQQRTGAV